MNKAPRSLLLRAVPGLCAAICAMFIFASGASAAQRPRIVGGQTAATGTWPYIARVVITSPGEVDTCSGTVVAPNVVLTAGHCAVDTNTMVTWDPSYYQVMTGAANTFSTGEISGVSQVIPYPDFETFSGPDGITPDRDLALLQLSTPTSAPPVQVATSADAYMYDGGTGAEMAGWGFTNSDSDVLPNTLQAANTVVQSTTYCQQQANVIFQAIYDSSAEMCAIDAPTDDQGTCEGDSGGPLIAMDGSGNPVEIGLTSWAAATCATARPGFFTNLMTFSSWISSEIQLLSPPALITQPATSATQTALTLHGTVNPNGTTTSYYFQYGAPGTTGHTTPTQSASNGTQAIPVSARLTGLKPGENVAYRLIAINANGPSTGQQLDSATLLPPLPEYGTYRGSGRQVQHITFNIKKNGTQLNELRFHFTVSCSRVRGRLSFGLSPAETFRLNTHKGLGLTAKFHDSEGWQYTLKGILTTKGRASGTISVTGHDPKDGVCRSGVLQWTAH